MARSVKKTIKEGPARPHYETGWELSEEYQLADGRTLVAGKVVSISGERGRFRFTRAVRRPDGVEWLDFLGGVSGYTRMRSFRPDRVKTIHRSDRLP